MVKGTNSALQEDGLRVWLELHLQLEVLETPKFWLEQFEEIPDIVACMYPEVFDPRLDHQKWFGQKRDLIACLQAGPDVPWH